MLVVVLLSGLVRDRLVDLGDLRRGSKEVGPCTLKDKETPASRRDPLRHECLFEAARQLPRLSRSFNYFIDSISISVPFHLRSFLDPICWRIWERGRTEAWLLVGLRISGFCGVVRLLRHIRSFVLLSLGCEREGRAGVCFSGMPHVRLSRSDKEKRGDRKGSRNTFAVQNEVGGGIHQSAMPRLSIEPSVRHCWYAI